jgi:hypothetical protein
MAAPLGGKFVEFEPVRKVSNAGTRQSARSVAKKKGTPPA